ncbi:M23 family metallopeptidase [Alkaliphilus transvaalensis]|uniref:M23 family metallopeptidase n=1 Tax=Alkaliphilus transvaalensis TaxID=114628 RepID=UPI000684E0CA|nr:M23 family metallopeptidase [Alkaliphilus transvaalensis]
MNRKTLFLILKKISEVSLVLQIVLMVVERTIYPPQDLVNIIRILLITGFILAALALPWVKNTSSLLKILSLMGIILYFIGLLFSDFYILIAIAILIGVLMILLSDSFEGTKDGNNKKEPFPLPEPAERSGNAKTLIKYFTSTMLTLLNPFQLVQMIYQIIGMIRLSKVEDFQQKGKYTLPFTDEWLILNGGIERKDSHSWDVINQRYAYDFVVADSKNKRHVNNGDNLKDYHCYGKSILSPADGKVIKIKDGIRDYPKPGTMTLDFLAKDFRGNFVMIEHEDKEYCFMAHFIPGSFEVKEGDLVKRGQIIGKCGNSGHSTEPHLHFHFQDHPNFYFGRGIPIKFSNLKINGEDKIDAYVKKEDRVAPVNHDMFIYHTRM